jgi:hypothetical protein
MNDFDKELSLKILEDKVEESLNKIDYPRPLAPEFDGDMIMKDGVICIVGVDVDREGNPLHKEN